MSVQPTAGQRVKQALESSGLAEHLRSETPEPSPNALTVLKRRYFKKVDDQGTQENQGQMLRRVAHNLAQADRNYEPDPELAELLVKETEQKFYDLMTAKTFLPNSPTLMNAGAELQQLSACFVLPVEDSMESIFDSVRNTALIHKSGGGTGFSFTRLRPEGDPVGSTGGVASGPVSFMNAFDAATESVKQGGTRRGANMAILNVDHPDIIQFIEAKLSGQHLQNFNISVGITEEFIRDAQQGLLYDLYNPRTGLPQGSLNAAEVFSKIVQSAWQTGDPGIVFLDRINADNPNPQLGSIESTNPCVTGDTIVQTIYGPYLVGELVDKPFGALVDGEWYYSTAEGFFHTGKKPTLTIITDQGNRLTLTPNHQVMVLGKYDQPGQNLPTWTQAGDLQPGDIVKLHNHQKIEHPQDEHPQDGEAKKATRFLRIRSDQCRLLIKRVIDEGHQLTNHHGQTDLTIQIENDLEAGIVASSLQRLGIQPQLNHPASENTVTIHAPDLTYLRDHLHLMCQKDNCECKALDTAIKRNNQKQTPQRIPTAHATIVSVEESGEQDVYDVQIPGINAFDANGFYVHNCGEQALLPYESCNLGSINLARMVTTNPQGEPAVNWNKLTSTVHQAVHLLDNVIDMNRYPLPQIEQMSKDTRRIGVGLMGWADMLVQLGIPYDSQPAIDLAEEIMREIQNQAYQASANLAQQRGPFPAWPGSIYNQKDNLWSTMRNSAPTTIAPTGTISIIADASSGIEPLYAISYVRNVLDQTKLVESNPYFEAIARAEGFYSEELMAQIAETGSVRNSPQVPEWVRDIFPISHDIDPEWHVRMQAAFQKHTDNCVSKTINFPNDASVADIEKAYLLAHQTGCKGLTVYRDGSKDQQVLSTGNSPQPGQQQPLPLLDPLQRGITTRKRPKVISGITELMRTGHGNMYITINFDEDDLPFEVFTNLGKAGGCDSAQLEAISRLTSMALRAGVDTEEIIHNLQGITCCPHWDEAQQIRSTPDAVAIALRRHSSPLQETERQSRQQPYAEQRQLLRYSGRDQCPECSAPTIRQEGCIQCTSPHCAWNKCD